MGLQLAAKNLASVVSALGKKMTAAKCEPLGRSSFDKLLFQID
jgi:hypothetical protein